MNSTLTRESAIWAGLGIVLLVALPLVLSGGRMTIVNEVIIWGIFAMGINVLLGYTGLVSVGHGMFMGIGGYGIAVLVQFAGIPVWPAIPLTILGSGLLGMFVGAIVMRVSRIQFLVVTLAIAELFYGTFTKLRATGGEDGMSPIDTFRPNLGWIGLDTSQTSGFYYWLLGCLLLVLLGLWRFLRSPFGSVLVGIRENEKRMVALGYNVAFYKIMAFTVSGAVSGLGGLLLCQNIEFVNPDQMAWEVSGEGLLMVIIGGRMFFVGPLLGAAFFLIVKDLLSEITEEYIIFLGLSFMAIVAFFSRGLAGYFVDLYDWEKRRAGRGPPAAEAATDAAE
jgi:branched-chain amino acid transport system permease protein